MSKYTQLTSEAIQESIEEFIDVHSLSAYDALPSERELSEILGVNRISLRKALIKMAGENRIYSVPSRGTFLSPAKFYEDASSHISFTSSWNAAGHSVRSTVLSFVEVEANLKISQTLSVSLGSLVYELRRLRLIDEVQIAIETSYLLVSSCPGLINFDFNGTRSLYATLETEFGLRIIQQQQNIRTTRLTEEEAGILHSVPGSSAFHITAVGRSEDGRSIEHSISITRADSYAINYRAVRFCSNTDTSPN